MAIQGIGGAGVGAITGAGAPQKTTEKFTSTFKGQLAAPKAQPRGETAPLKVQAARAEAHPNAQASKAVAGAMKTQPQKALEPAKMIDHVAAAQKRMDA